ncbi:hypothetical protein KKG22_02435 [Patescibacteria group bacterium]|nr:hypothetical protein [Patescibacteria group bacterium]MBU1721790.1 hypothetical protein [Patescibacteria group bacterium]
MKKTLTTLCILALCFVTVGCNKTEIDEDFQNEREGGELMTQEEADALRADGDTEFEEDYMRELDDATTEAHQNEQMGIVDDLIKAEGDKLSGKNIKGSCNAIAESSTCIDYYGSFWTGDSARLNCSDSGTFSKDACPQDSYGGCNTGEGTQADMVVWMYPYGGGEIEAEGIKYAKMACDATLASSWIAR